MPLPARRRRAEQRTIEGARSRAGEAVFGLFVEASIEEIFPTEQGWLGGQTSVSIESRCLV
jgi:hypothetical protein